MSNRLCTEDPTEPAPSNRSYDNVACLEGGAFVSKPSGDGGADGGRRPSLSDVRRGHGATAPGRSTQDPGSVPETKRDDPNGPVKMAASSPRLVETDEISGCVSGFPCRAVGSEPSRSEEIRRRLNAAARPILESFARRQGLSSKRLLGAIAGPTPLTHPAVARDLGGALHSEVMRSAIAANADPALVPLQVRAGLAKLMAQDLAIPPSGEAKEAFADWDKPLVPAGHHHPALHAKGAVAWLRTFPPTRCLPQPLDTWDDATAALWLNDRSSIVSGPQGEGLDDVVVSIDAANPWKPSLEVLHTLYDLELEELAYRVFVERLRREVMPSYLSKRRILVRDALLHVTFGYRTLQDARRHVREHDLKRIRLFNRLFGVNCEWVYDLCCRIIDTYAWPSGFSEPELWSEFSEQDDIEPR